MNPFATHYNPMNAFAQGFALGDAFTETEARELERTRLLKQREALAQIGQQDQLIGFDGVAGATRPAWLKQLYATNPEAALQVEQHVSAPFELDRAAKKAGEVESAKLAAKVAAWKPFMEDGGGQPSTRSVAGQPVSNAFATGGVPLAVGVETDEGITATGGPMVGSVVQPGGFGPYTNTMSGNTLRTANRTKRTKKLSLEHGPSVEIEDIPEFEAEKVRVEAEQKGRQLELESSKTADILNNSRLAEVDRAHKRVFETKAAIRAIDSTESKIHPAVRKQQKDALTDDLNDAIAYRDALLKGRGAIEASSAGLTDEEKAMAKAGPGTKRPAQPTPAIPAKAATPASLSIGAGLPYEKQVEAQADKLKGDIGQMRKIIDDSHASATSALQNKPATDRILELLQKNDLGNRIYKLPGGETAATIFSGNYDELNKWRQSLILQEKSEGESQLYNTLPELKIHSESLPSVDNDENTNRRAIVPIKNLMEARLLAPQFLEDWAHRHGGSLVGARQAVRSWMQHNPMYQTSEANGAVSIHENMHYIPLDVWTRLRQRFDEKTLLQKRDNGGIQVINGRVFFKE